MTRHPPNKTNCAKRFGAIDALRAVFQAEINLKYWLAEHGYLVRSGSRGNTRCVCFRGTRNRLLRCPCFDVAVVQGERRFYLGGVVDDLFLSTGVWIYDPPSFFGPTVRRRGETAGKRRKHTRARDMTAL